MMNRRISENVSKLTNELDRVIIGYEDVKRFSIAAMLSDQHVLLEGVPGTAKTRSPDAKDTTRCVWAAAFI